MDYEQPGRWIDKWSEKYPVSYDTGLKKLAGREAFTPDDLEMIYKWKYRGLWPKRKIESMRAFPAGQVESLSRRAFLCADDLGALRILMLIPGAQAAGASAILMAHNPDLFTVMDVRAIKSLIWLKRWSAEEQGTKASSLRWPDYPGQPGIRPGIRECWLAPGERHPTESNHRRAQPA